MANKTSSAGRLIVAVRERTKKKILSMAEKKGITFKQLILDSLGVKDEE